MTVDQLLTVSGRISGLSDTKYTLTTLYTAFFTWTYAIFLFNDNHMHTIIYDPECKKLADV
jgi:Trk-type K+ transport system membrane component